MHKVFFIDDEPWVLSTLKHLIDWQLHGFEICGAADNVRDAIEAIERLQPDLVISDIRMPELSGLELIEYLDENFPAIEVILISGYADFEYAKKAISFSCKGYLLKPIDEAELISVLQKVKSSIKRNSLLLDVEEIHGDPFLSSDQLTGDMIRFIQQNFDSTLSLRTLSDKFQMSESHISNLIKKNSGKSFIEHLTNFRIQKAKELLRDTNQSVDAIASEVGYFDYAYFSKVYKKITGVTPAQYRKSL